MGFERLPALTGQVKELAKTVEPITDLAKELGLVRGVLPEVITGLNEVARLKGILFDRDDVGSGVRSSEGVTEV